MTVEEFRKQILIKDFEDILNNVLLNDIAVHVSPEQHSYIIKIIAEKYRIAPETIQLIIVGSAKLGFSISEGKKNGVILPRYRSFSPISDIDVAIICPPIFDMIWNELSRFSFAKPFFPWYSKRLGDYLVCGWMRPDHFPRKVRLRKCDDWWDIFRYLSSRHYLGRRTIRAGLFYNLQQLQTYQSKALTECIEYEKLEQ